MVWKEFDPGKVRCVAVASKTCHTARFSVMIRIDDDGMGLYLLL